MISEFSTQQIFIKFGGKNLADQHDEAAIRSWISAALNEIFGDSWRITDYEFSVRIPARSNIFVLKEAMSHELRKFRHLEGLNFRIDLGENLSGRI
ncbi:hypothetical protein [Methylobacterium sp. 190mf]|uniref:hypothetical protein n=1 Tax=Methylobacterium sp. 190mf TaxID=1761798 RepID=UPI0011B03015|nr:hypothetical protein [Methylobacterium sp. 190mf]